MSKQEMIAAIEALGWHGLVFNSEKATAYHATNPEGWQVWQQPGPGEEEVLRLFLRDIQNPELLAQYR